MDNEKTKPQGAVEPASTGYAAAVTKLRVMAKESSERAFAYEDKDDWEGYKRCLAEYNLLSTAATWLEETDEPHNVSLSDKGVASALLHFTGHRAHAGKHIGLISHAEKTEHGK